MRPSWLRRPALIEAGQVRIEISRTPMRKNPLGQLAVPTIRPETSFALDGPTGLLFVYDEEGGLERVHHAEIVDRGLITDPSTRRHRLEESYARAMKSMESMRVSLEEFSRLSEARRSQAEEGAP